MNKATEEQVKALQRLIDLMVKEQNIPRDLQITFNEIHDYIIRNE